MGVTSEENNYRYPGTKFFEAHQSSIFFGREQETADLVHAIKAHDVFVIFADSGTGKTSLLNAGLLPSLATENIEPIRFRFQDIDASPLKTIAKQLSEYLAEPGKAEEEERLWKLFKQCDFKNKTPLFVLDQFEEFFNHQKTDRENCITELADLIDEYLPAYVKEEMRARFRDRDPTPEELKYYTPAHVKMLFLIRADKLKLLDDLSKKIPLILRNRFHLKALSALQAEQAIVLPAALSNQPFASPPFTFEEQAINEMVAYLKNEEGEVESFQLQLLCQELEKQVMKQNGNGTAQKRHVVTAAQLGGEEGMDNITKNYYTNQINSISDETLQHKARELLEDKLIVDERRISLPEVLLLSQGYPAQLLDYLLNTTRLIRVDNDRYVEISHDRLLSSILQSKQQREEEERRQKEREELEQLKAKEQEKTKALQKQKEEEIKNLELLYLKDRVKKAARLRVYIVALIILLIAFIYAGVDANRASRASKIAMANYYRSLQNYDSAQEALEAHNLFSFFDFVFPNQLKKVSDTIRNEKALQRRFLSLIQQGDTLEMQGNNLLNTTDSLLFAADSLTQVGDTASNAFKNMLAQISSNIGGNNYMRARMFYTRAQQLGYVPVVETLGAGNKLRDLDKVIPDVFKQCINAAIVLYKAHDLPGAKTAYQKAKKVNDFANDPSHNISLDSEDLPYLDSLKQKLQ